MWFNKKIGKRGQFQDSVKYWHHKLRALTHNLQSLMRTADENKKKELQSIIDDYINITDRLDKLTESPSLSNNK